ncbi:hypothetical protein ACH4ZU_12130 [Streptomyces sp. NPDC020472]|uniref:hypothetical protein n=1 Tax=Streptomyces sp. NPDC020472 TaxID=3365075 RepID=UPI00378CD2D5
MNKYDDRIAFTDPTCGATSLLIRMGDVVIAGYYLSLHTDPLSEVVLNFDHPTYEGRVVAAKGFMDDTAISHILTGWELIAT